MIRIPDRTPPRPLLRAAAVLAVLVMSLTALVVP
jgi:hypothetical protein